MKHFRRATLLVVGFALAANFATPANAARPNVIVFLADDAGWGDYSHNGNTNIRTPNIDSIATGGAKFDRFYVCAVCAPTRAEFLTGRYHPRGGVRGVSTGQERLNLDERTVADAFKAAGYSTGAFGKWHNGSQWPYHPQARGFDEYYGHTSGHWGEYFDPPIEHNGKMIREKGYIVDLCTDKAIDFINRNQEKPFFCYVPFTTPHSPWAVPDSFWQRFRTKPIGLRATDPAQEVDEHTRCALAMVEQQDWNVGRILRRLDELKLTENTIIAYFSDNGPNSSRWTGGMKGRKGSVDEGGVRSPLILRWPARIAPGTMVREITGAIDLLPTLTSLAGVKRVGDKPLDGLDLTPLLLGQKWQRPERFLFNVQNNSISVRSQQYRLDPQGALFDMVADPGQTKNVASEKSDVAASMAKALADWRASIPGAAKAPEPSAATAKAGKNKGGKGGGGGTLLPPDDRAYTVGYREFPWTPLPARDGVPNGGVQRSSGAPNSSYFVNWKSKDDSMTWDIEVNSTGNYEVVIDYTAAEAGATLELEFKGSKLSGKVAPAWNPPLYTNQDTIARPAAESQMKEFRPLNLGVMRLEKGRGQLTLRATDIPGASVMDVRRVNLTLK